MHFFYSMSQYPFSFRNRMVSYLFIFLTFIVLTSCEKPAVSADESNVCGDSRTGNSMSAKLGDTQLCTDLGTALLFNSGGNQLTINGFFGDADPAASITLNIINPQVGMNDLLDGFYSSIDESIYYVVNENEGFGMINITSMTETRVTGTFELTALEINAASGQSTGNQVLISEGSFAFSINAN